MQKLKIDDNNRFIVREDGSPFVWIGETNWFFARLPPATIDSILDARSRQGFTIMSVSCRENMYNGEGIGSIDDPNEMWWDYLDEYIAKCARRNLYVGITLGWWGLVKKHSEGELYDYGKWVGTRYKDANNIIWLTLGEAGGHLRKDSLPSDKIGALVRGIRDGDSGDKLLTVHADYKRGTSLYPDYWDIDFNNWQTGQWCCPKDLPRKDKRKWTVWEALQLDYEKLYDGKPKPTLDSEAWYENNKDFCGATPFIIRRRAYFTIFAGAFGHTYGAGGIWDGLKEERECSGDALSAIQYDGAREIGYIGKFLKNLNEDLLKLRPDQQIITGGNSDDYDTHIQATVANDNSFILAYSASDAPYNVDISNLSGRNISAIWYNPRSHRYSKPKVVPIKDGDGKPRFDPPGNSGAGKDWVLILGAGQTIEKLTK